MTSEGSSFGADTSCATNLTPGPAGEVIVTAPVAAGGVGTQIASFSYPGLTAPATKDTAYTFAVSAPIGLTTLAANVTRGTFEAANGDSRVLGNFAVAALYSLSKNTTVYTSAAFHNGYLKDFICEKNIFQLGLRKAF